MDNLKEQVQEVMESIDEEYRRFDSLQDQVDILYDESSKKIRETVETLQPLMQIMRNRNHFFRGVDCKYKSLLGPVFKHDTKENELYVFDVERMQPRKINLYDDETKGVSYRRLLDNVDFTVIMDSLLLVLTHHKEAQHTYEELVLEMQTALNKY